MMKSPVIPNRAPHRAPHRAPSGHRIGHHFTVPDEQQVGIFNMPSLNYCFGNVCGIPGIHSPMHIVSDTLEQDLL
jgi:hypothetical protein